MRSMGFWQRRLLWWRGDNLNKGINPLVKIEVVSLRIL